MSGALDRVRKEARDRLEQHSRSYLTLSLEGQTRDDFAHILVARIDDAARCGIYTRLLLTWDVPPSYEELRLEFRTVKARMLRGLSPYDVLRPAVKAIRLYRSWSGYLIIPGHLIDDATATAAAFPHKSGV